MMDLRNSMMKNMFMKRIKEFVDQNQWIIVFLYALPFLNESFPTSYFICILIRYDIFKYLSFGLLILLFVRKKKKVSLLLDLLIVLEGMLIISSLINHETFGTDEYWKMFSDIVCILSMGLIVECFIDRPKDLIRGLLLNFEIAVYSYFIGYVFILSGQNYYKRGLLATLNLWILPGICIALLHVMINKGYFRSVLLIIISLFVTYRVWNATTVVALTGMFGVIAVGYVLLKMKNRKISLGFLLAAAVALNLFVLFIYSGNDYPFVSFVIEKILRKSTSFTERDVIWAEAIRMIREKPIFGHGSRPVLAVANSFADEYPHSHNQILQKLNESGVFGLAVFSLMHAQLIRKVDGSRNSLARIAVTGAMFGIFMTYITEAYKKFYVFYLIFFLAYDCDKLKGEIEYGVIEDGYEKD